MPIESADPRTLLFQRRRTSIEHDSDRDRDSDSDSDSDSII